MHGSKDGGSPGALSPAELRAAREFVRRVRRGVPADLVQASLFGSKARGEARPDSDVDVLLVFARLPPDREPHATLAEEIAGRVARESGIPVTTWSVSLVDLELGQRTPMLVDALADSVPLWWRDRPLPRLPFTPPDAVRCVRSLLDRTAEGAVELAAHLAAGHRQAATRRVRDDLVRVCTAALLLRGVTRPRRGEAVRAFVEMELAHEPPPEWVRRVLAWAARSFGASGREEGARVAPPPGGVAAAARVVEGVRRGVIRGVTRLQARLGPAREPLPRSGIPDWEWVLRP